MSKQSKIEIRPANSNELETIYQLVTGNDEWTHFNGPYFPYSHPTMQTFEQTTFQRLMQGNEIQLIIYDGNPVGSVNCYWECKDTRWLEAGVVIYDQNCWGKGIAKVAVSIWISTLFDSLDIERVGMTTWSGNPRMMALAIKLGLQLEGRLRKVRFYNNRYYDSIKYGVLREEWEALHA